MASAVESHDFVQGTGSVEQSQLLLAQATYLSGQNTGPIDTSTWESLLIAAISNTGLESDLSVLLANSTVAGGVVDQQDLTFTGAITELGSTGGVFWKVAARGDSMIITNYTSDPAGNAITVYGSTRPVTGRAISPFFNRGRLLLDIGSVNVPANGNSTTWGLPPTDNGYWFTYNIPGAGDCSLRMEGVYFAPPNVVSDYSSVSPSTNGVNQQGELKVGNVGHSVFFHNNTAGALTCSTRIWERVP